MPIIVITPRNNQKVTGKEIVGTKNTRKNKDSLDHNTAGIGLNTQKNLTEQRRHSDTRDQMK